MLLMQKKKFCFLAAPKTGTTAIESWGKEAKGVVFFSHYGRMKHVNYRTFVKLLDLYGMPHKEFETCCILRHPFATAISWYNFRNRETAKLKKGPERFLGGTSLEQYLESLIHKKTELKKNYTICRSFVLDENGDVGVTRIFKYENFDSAVAYLQEKLRLDDFPVVKNVSPKVALTVDDDLKRQFFSAFREEIDWYEALDSH